MTPSLILAQHVWEYIDEVVKLVPAEVGGVGYVTETPNGNLYVDEVFLMDQEVSMASVEFKGDAIAAAIERSVKDGRIEDLRFSWHSHANMDVYWSTTDETGIEAYLRGGMPWLASYVVNKAKKDTARIDVQNVPVLGTVTFENLKVERVQEFDPTEGRAASDVKEYVTEVRSWQKNWNKGPKGVSGMSSGKEIMERIGMREDGAPGGPPISDELGATAAELRQMGGWEDAMDWTPDEVEKIEKHSGKKFADLSDDQRLDIIIEADFAEAGLA
jgi:hypothetical protein